ncbi:MAG: hypothetical protein RR489_05140 [Clostridia bacterium]
MKTNNINSEPRWLYEEPGGTVFGHCELTVEEKKEAEIFEKAVKSGRIDEWFANNGKLND